MADGRVTGIASRLRGSFEEGEAAVARREAAGRTDSFPEYEAAAAAFERAEGRLPMLDELEGAVRRRHALRVVERRARRRVGALAAAAAVAVTVVVVVLLARRSVPAGAQVTRRYDRRGRLGRV